MRMRSSLVGVVEMSIDDDSDDDLTVETLIGVAVRMCAEVVTIATAVLDGLELRDRLAVSSVCIWPAAFSRIACNCRLRFD